MRIGLAGVDGSHAEDFLRHFNAEARYDGMRITALWGGDDARLAALAALAPEVAVASSLDALVRSVDAVIVGDRDGRLHKDHALPILEAYKPVFIDKPLACTLVDAEELVAAAGRAGTPLLSGSALRWQTETAMLKARLAGIDAPFHLEVWGTWYPDNTYGGAIYYAIHTVELALELLGPEWRKVKRDAGHATRFRFRSGDATVALEFRPLDALGSSSFGVAVGAPGIAFVNPIPLGDDYMLPVANRIAAMFRTGESPMRVEDLLAPLRLMEEIDRLLLPVSA